jgi:hypothetical protein
MSASSLVQYLHEFSETAEAEYDESVHGTAAETPEVLAIILAAIRDHRADLAALAKKIEGHLMAMAGEKRFLVAGLGEVEIRKQNRYTHWDNESLTRVLVALALDERRLIESTGEYEPSHEAVARVLSECSRPSWRLTPLRARGIPIDEYCEVDDQGYAVQLPPRATP